MQTAIDLGSLKARVEQAQTEILQGYFAMSIQAGSNASNWVNDYEAVLLKGITGSHRSSYAAAKNKFDAVGCSSFDFKHLDVSIIYTLFRHDFKDMHLVDYKARSWLVARYLECIHDDRNDSAHYSWNNGNFGQVDEILTRLIHLKRFIKAVSHDFSVDHNSRSVFYDKWSIRLSCIYSDFEDAFSSLEDEQLLKAEIVNAIKLIRESQNESPAYLKQLIDFWPKNDSNHDAHVHRIIEFIRAAADAGIQRACMDLGDFYYYGIAWSHPWPRDYEIAASCYRAAGASLDDEHRIHLANIYLNELSEGHSKQEGETLKASYLTKVPGKALVPVTVDGMCFYEYRNVEEAQPLRGAHKERKPPVIIDIPRPTSSGIARKGASSPQGKKKSLFPPLKAEEYLRKHSE